MVPFQNVVKNQSVSQEVLDFRGGGQDFTKSSSSARKIPQVLLEKFFSDWTERVNYQNQQVKFFKSGKKKLRESKRVRMPNTVSLTFREQDAFDYFHGTGFYKDYQNPKTFPNIFDTRQSFLIKMEDREMRTKFLNNYNKRKLTENNLTKNRV